MTRARDIAAAATALSVDGTVKLDGNYPVGTNNVALGYTALNGSLTGSENVAVGTYSLDALTSGAYNSGLGYGTLSSTTTGSNNSAVGNGSLISNTSGSYNAALGAGALSSNTTASYNTATGLYAGYSNSTGTHNSYYGGYAGYYQLGVNNVSIGYGSLLGASGGSSTGGANTAVGRDALASNTTASNNTAVGYQALYANTTGTDNTAVGFQTLDACTTGYSNVAVGGAATYQAAALGAITTGYNNVGIGAGAGSALTTASSCTIVGRLSGYSTTGSNNTFLGEQAGYLVTTGASNTIIGRFNGNQGGLDIRTSSNNIVLSDGDGNPRGFYNGAVNGWVIGDGNASTYWPNSASVNNHNGVMIFPLTGALGITTNQGTALYLNRNSTSSPDGNVADFYRNGVFKGSISVSSSSTAYNTSSDYRLKENVVELTGATDRLKQLNPSRFNFIADPDTTVDGFIAHEVQTVVPEAITGTKDEVDADGNPVYQGIDQSKLVPLLVATIKELEARITALEAN
jgi:hypothetical protein